jgi:hypothetical protein
MVAEMNRDVGELPLIIGDLEDGVKLIQENLYVLLRLTDYAKAFD